MNNISDIANEKFRLKGVKFRRTYKKHNNYFRKIIIASQKRNYKYFCIFIFIIGFLIYLYICIKKLSEKFDQLINNIDLNLINENNNIINSYIIAKRDFCKNPDKNYIKKYEDEISLKEVKINELNYQIYIFKSSNFLLGLLKESGNFESTVGNNIIEALKFYGRKNNIIHNKDITILDIGGNVGWYPSLLGRYGYNIKILKVNRNYQ